MTVLQDFRNSLTTARKALDEATKSMGDVSQCFCIGPQDGAPVCPCRMRSLRIQHGRYVEVIDHGPAPAPDDLDI
jgi:hypothetical protein